MIQTLGCRGGAPGRLVCVSDLSVQQKQNELTERGICVNILGVPLESVADSLAFDCFGKPVYFLRGSALVIWGAARGILAAIRR